MDLKCIDKHKDEDSVLEFLSVAKEFDNGISLEDNVTILNMDRFCNSMINLIKAKPSKLQYELAIQMSKSLMAEIT